MWRRDWCRPCQIWTQVLFWQCDIKFQKTMSWTLTLKRYGPPSYQMHREPFDFNKLPPEEKKKILQTQRTQRSGFISRGMQTDLRETETQTDPYSPPYKLPYPGAYPKVLALAKLTWGRMTLSYFSLKYAFSKWLFIREGTAIYSWWYCGHRKSTLTKNSGTHGQNCRRQERVRNTDKVDGRVGSSAVGGSWEG